MTLTPDQQIDELINRHEASWRLGYDAFPAVLNQLGLKRGAEIGVAFGGHSEAILKNTSVTKLYAIDSYKHRPEYDDPMNLPQPVFDRLYERTGQRLSAFGDRATQIRLDSVEAAEHINEPLDFVYIDGDHSYQGIRADLEAYFPLVREGGIIAGHDYGQPAFPGVKAAADHFFKRFGLTVHHEGKGIWWAHRPAAPLTLVIPASDTAFCDATFYTRLQTAGLTEQDTILLIHDEQHAIDAASRVLSAHPKLVVQPIHALRGPWHALTSVAEQIETPLVMCLAMDTTLAPGTIQTLRDRLCNSGAMAAAIAGTQRSNDFALADLLATSSPPTSAGQSLWMTHAVKQAIVSQAIDPDSFSDRLIPWLMLAEILANGGRLALEPGKHEDAKPTWTTQDCRIAADQITRYAPLIDGTDLLRLKWPTIASDWLNQLDRKPVRTRVNIRPIDAPPTYDPLHLLDRVVHKLRRAMKGAA